MTENYKLEKLAAKQKQEIFELWIKHTSRKKIKAEYKISEWTLARVVRDVIIEQQKEKESAQAALLKQEREKIEKQKQGFYGEKL